MKSLLLTGLAGALIAFPAVAQETVEDQPFTGVYVGGSVGFDAQPNDVNESVLFDRNVDGRFNDTIRNAAGANAFGPGFCNGQARASTPGGCLNDRDDISYSARVGWDQQMGRAVIGVVGEFGRSEIRDSVSAFSTTPANYVMNRELD